MGPLALSPGTQRMNFGRDLEIGNESEIKLSELLKNNRIDEEPFELGEVSFHSGWLFHRAGANSSAKAREVFTIIYLDERTCVLLIRGTRTNATTGIGGALVYRLAP